MGQQGHEVEVVDRLPAVCGAGSRSERPECVHKKTGNHHHDGRRHRIDGHGERHHGQQVQPRRDAVAQGHDGVVEPPHVTAEHLLEVAVTLGGLKRPGAPEKSLEDLRSHLPIRSGGQAHGHFGGTEMHKRAEEQEPRGSSES